ncbi:unnamed protein product [Paramecium sonneborni]|uniref:Uncharacterized protein n=1 Tax=Paramecium sonneborni TaxID=65129 RepID=A0A8S1RPY8_9CILI|nr:unnamed protein product [Paramecium sonneborni]
MKEVKEKTIQRSNNTKLISKDAFGNLIMQIHEKILNQNEGLLYILRDAFFQNSNLILNGARIQKINKFQLKPIR